MNNLIICPNCHKKFELSAIFQHELKELKDKQIKEAIDKVEIKIKKELSDKNNLLMADLKQQLIEKEKKVDDLKNEELKLRQEKRLLEDKEKDFELLMQRKIDEEKRKIAAVIEKQTTEKHRFDLLEREKIIESLKKSLEEAQRKAKVSSQQLQGEVMELDFEQLLRESFKDDEIIPIEKGSKGADIKQIVKSPRGYICGIILWETKRTKLWADAWLSKLKSDLREEKANIPVIITNSYPKEMDKELGLQQGVWITSFSLAIPLAILLRKNLLDIGYQKAISLHKGKKTDFLYEYITGHEFRNQVEGIIEVYKEMNEQLSKEKAAIERQWKIREAQVQRMLSGTANIIGSIQGRIGINSLPIKGLELPEST